MIDRDDLRRYARPLLRDTARAFQETQRINRDAVPVTGVFLAIMLVSPTLRTVDPQDTHISPELEVMSIVVGIILVILQLGSKNP